jgi:hypothetical protein
LPALLVEGIDLRDKGLHQSERDTAPAGLHRHFDDARRLRDRGPDHFRQLFDPEVFAKRRVGGLDLEQLEQRHPLPSQLRHDDRVARDRPQHGARLDQAGVVLRRERLTTIRDRHTKLAGKAGEVRLRRIGALRRERGGGPIERRTHDDGRERQQRTAYGPANHPPAMAQQ